MMVSTEEIHEPVQSSGCLWLLTKGALIGAIILIFLLGFFVGVFLSAVTSVLM